jgi:dTDP-glucose pyrophosphorylase
MKDTVVLIPAAGRVPEGVLSLSNIGCTAMIPIAGRPVIHWTMRYLRDLGLRRFVVAVPRRGLFIEEFVDCAFGNDCEVQFIVPSSDRGVGGTVQELAQAGRGESALVVLGDTSFQLVDPAPLDGPDPFVLVGPVDESYRWCVADVGADRVVTALHDKRAGLPAPCQALIGVYYFPSLPGLRTAATDAASAGRRVEMADILERVRRDAPLRALPAASWLDCGNADRQAASHRAMLQKRDFNELAIDETLGTITKRSRHVEKFVDEINYLRLLPPELAILFPRVLDWSVDFAAPYLRMEYYGYPTLADVFVYENVDPGIWERIFQHLHRIVTGCFMAHRRPLPSGAVRSMYLDKTKQRVAKLDGALAELAAHQGSITLNGRTVRNLPVLWDELEARVVELERTSEGSVVHGDLCLSNILYDLRSRICKLVDPRGSFGAVGLHGDPRYDVAKLFHSVYGRYDFIVNDLFRVERSGARIDLEIRTTPQHDEIEERFERVFFGDGRFARRDVLLITGLLFASMPALHYDHPRRQLAMYATALSLLDEALT